MRLFCGIDVPDDFSQRLDAVIAPLRPLAAIKWSPLENLHITTRFIGHWPEARLEELSQALRSLVHRAPFQLRLHGFGWFPSVDRPRVLWAGAVGGPALLNLTSATSGALASLGIPPEDKPYSPHLTLARLNTRISPALRAKVEELSSIPLGSYCVDGFYLYASSPGNGLSVYRKLIGYRFITP